MFPDKHQTYQRDRNPRTAFATGAYGMEELCNMCRLPQKICTKIQTLHTNTPCLPVATHESREFKARIGQRTVVRSLINVFQIRGLLNPTSLPLMMTPGSFAATSSIQTLALVFCTMKGNCLGFVTLAIPARWGLGILPCPEMMCPERLFLARDPGFLRW